MASLARYFIRVRCLECGKRWKVRDTSRDPQCSRCNSVDIDVDTDSPRPRITMTDPNQPYASWAANSTIRR